MQPTEPVRVDADRDVEPAPSGGEEPASLTSRQGKRFLIVLLVIVAVGVAIRFPYLWFDRRHVDFLGDSYYYHHGANLLADGEGFINPFTRNFFGETHEAADHPPGYLVYLSLFSWVGLRSVTAHMFANALLGLSGIVLAGYAGRRIAGDRVGLVAAALVAIAPNVWRYDGAMLSEVLVIPLTLLTVLLAYRYWDRASVWRLVCVGVVIGIGTLTRPELFMLVALLIVPLALLTRTVPWRSRIAWTVAASLAATAVIAPWLVFNAARFDHTVLFTQNLGQTIGGANCESTYYGEIVGYWDFDCPVEVLAANGITRSSDDQERSERLIREAGIDYMREHADRVPAVVAVRLGRIVGLYRPAQQRDLDALTEGVTWWVANLSMVSLYPTIVGTVAGAVVLRRRGRLLFPLLAPIVTVLATVVVFYAASRFRSTAEGPMLVLGAVAIVAGWSRVRQRFRRDLPARAPPDEPEPAPVRG